MTEEDLLKECLVETMRSQGAGGQHVNKTESAVRITHLPTGIVVKCQETKSQHRNKSIALQNLKRKLIALNRPKKKRIPTKLPRAVKRKNLDSKKRRGTIKKLRSKKNIEF